MKCFHRAGFVEFRGLDGVVQHALGAVHPHLGKFGEQPHDLQTGVEIPDAGAVDHRYGAVPDCNVGSDNATMRPKASWPLEIMIERISGGRLSFAGSFAGVTLIEPMRPFLACRTASVAPGAAIVQFRRLIPARNRPGRPGLWTKPEPNPNVKDK
jgi:hypothetical protein